MTTREQKLREMVSELRSMAAKELDNSNDKNWSEWLRDRHYGKGSGLRCAANMLAYILNEEVEVSEDMVERSCIAWFEMAAAGGNSGDCMRAAITTALKEAGK